MPLLLSSTKLQLVTAAALLSASGLVCSATACDAVVSSARAGEDRACATGPGRAAAATGGAEFIVISDAPKARRKAGHDHDHDHDHEDHEDKDGSDEEQASAWSDGKTDVKVVRKDGQIRVFVNGAEAMTLEDDQNALGDDARRMRDAARRELRMLRESINRARLAPLAAGAPVPPDAPAPPAPDGPSPRVMIGVTMESAAEFDSDLPDGVDADNATVITRVVDGLPADAAGLEQGDLIIRINGEPSAGPGDIRRVLAAKQPGDTLNVRVYRDGTEQDMVITLAEFDGEKLEQPRSWGFTGDDDVFEDASERSADVRSSIAKLSEELEVLGSKLATTDSTRKREELAAQLAETSQKIAEMTKELAELSAAEEVWRGFRQPDSGSWSPRYRMPLQIRPGQGGMPPRAFVITPDEHGGRRAELEDRLEGIDDRLERLEQTLEKLAEHMSAKSSRPDSER